MTRPRIELDHRSLFFRTIAFVFLLTQMLLWMHLPRGGRPGQRIVVTLFTIPSSLVIALVIAAVLTMTASLMVRFLIRPLVEQWHSPVVDDSLGPFHLAANEWIVESSPARRRKGWRWTPGNLVRTNLRLWFFPRIHESDVWSCLLGSLRDVELEPVPEVASGLIRHWPERIVVRVGDDLPETFAVPEPHSVSSWLKPVPAEVAHVVRS